MEKWWPFLVGVVIIIVFVAGLALVAKERAKREVQNVKFSTEELGLICAALSDSMNYKPNDKFNEKWGLLLKCTKAKMDAEGG